MNKDEFGPDIGFITPSILFRISPESKVLFDLLNVMVVDKKVVLNHNYSR